MIMSQRKRLITLLYIQYFLRVVKRTCSTSQDTGSCSPRQNNGCSKGCYLRHFKGSTCYPTEPGRYSRDNDFHIYSCPPGKVQPNRQEDTCKPCISGKYQPLWEQMSCLACEYGKYQDGEGSSECKDCPPGNYQHTNGGYFIDNNGEHMCLLSFDISPTPVPTTAPSSPVPSSEPSDMPSSEASNVPSTLPSTIPTALLTSSNDPSNIPSLVPTISLPPSDTDKNPNNIPSLSPTFGDEIIEGNCSFIKKRIFHNCEVKADSFYRVHSSSSCNKKGMMFQQLVTIIFLAYFSA